MTEYETEMAGLLVYLGHSIDEFRQHATADELQDIEAATERLRHKFKREWKEHRGWTLTVPEGAVQWTA